jgi:hypothetical protein
MYLRYFAIQATWKKKRKRYASLSKVVYLSSDLHCKSQCIDLIDVILGALSKERSSAENRQSEQRGGGPSDTIALNAKCKSWQSGHGGPGISWARGYLWSNGNGH